MKKRILTILAAMMLTVSASAQVFLMNEDEDNDRNGIPEENISIINPGYHNSGEDWYTPVGNGALLLTAMGSAYLLTKKKRKK